MNEKIKKILIYCIFAISCIFISNIKVSAYTGSDTVNIIPSTTWANHYNYIFSDGVSISQDIVNNQINSMLPIIEQNLITYNTPYYFIQLNNTSSSYLGYIVMYLSNISQFTSMNLETYAFESTTQNEIQFEGNIATVKSQTFIFNTSSSTISDISTVGNQNSYYHSSLVYGMLSLEGKYQLYVPTTFFIKTNIPIENINAIKFTPNTYYNYPNITIDGVPIAKGSTNYVGDYFGLIQDDEQPILDFAGITTPFEMWQGDTFTVPMPTAYDNIDGDISSNIQVTSTLNPNVIGTYNITYEVCDSSNNCTSATIPITVKNPWVEINMTGKSAVIFWYKDFTQVLNPNAYCDSIELQGSCFVQKFYYQGRWKYSKVNLNDLDTLLYEDGGIYAPIDPAMTNYQNYEHINIGHLTSDFDLGDEYGVLMYNESGANIVKLKYNQKYFDYRIYNSLNDTDEKEIPYIDAGGNNQITTDIQPPYTQLEDPATVTNPTSAGLFGSFTTNTYGLTAIISAPLNLINQLTSKECASINLPLPFLDNKFLTLPCMTTIYETYFGSFFTLYQLITFGVVSYWVIVRLLNMIKDFKNPNHDEIEVLDL